MYCVRAILQSATALNPWALLTRQEVSNQTYDCDDGDDGDVGDDGDDEDWFYLVKRSRERGDRRWKATLTEPADSKENI